MSARTVPMSAATSSRARSVQSYYPYYPPPLYPEATEGNGYAGFVSLPPSYTDERTDKGIVNRRNLRYGEINNYSWGGVQNPVFHARATGQVESTVFQGITNMPHIVQQNNFLYRAAKGYPRNLGLSEKVPTLPQEALGNTPWGAMQPRPQFTRNIFTRRPYAAAKSIPAQPQAK